MNLDLAFKIECTLREFSSQSVSITSKCVNDTQYMSNYDGVSKVNEQKKSYTTDLAKIHSISIFFLRKQDLNYYDRIFRNHLQNEATFAKYNVLYLKVLWELMSQKFLYYYF